MINQAIRQAERVPGVQDGPTVSSINGKTGDVQLTYSDIPGTIPSSSLPSYVDDVIEGTLINSTTFQVNGQTITPETGKIYVTPSDQKSYRWSGSAFVRIVSAPDETVQLVWSQGTNINVEVGTNTIILPSIDTLNNKYFTIDGPGMDSVNALTIKFPQVNAQGLDFGKRVTIYLGERLSNGTYSRREVIFEETASFAPKVIGVIPAYSSIFSNASSVPHTFEVSNLKNQNSLLNYPSWNYNLDLKTELYSPISITYENLKNIKNSNLLKAGQRYIITDFRLRWQLQLASGSWSQFSSATIEPLIVYATSSNQIAHEAYSTLHPEDIVYYDFDATKSYTWGANGTSGPNISNFKGWIYRRVNSVKNIDIGWDWRYITNYCAKPNLSAVPLYDAGTTYSRYTLVKSGSGKLYLSLDDNNIGTGLDSSSWKSISSYVEADLYFPIKIGASGVNICFYLNLPNNSTLQIPADSATFQQMYTFSNTLVSAGVLTIDEVKNIKITRGFQNVFLATSCQNIEAIGEFSENLIGSSFSNNKIIGDFKQNLIGTTFQQNNLCNFINNYTQLVFMQNTFRAECRNNLFGSLHQSNSHYGTVDYNIIKDEFSYNQTLLTLDSCLIDPYFRNNNVLAHLSSDLRDATTVYLNFDKTITTNAFGQNRLTYLNSSDQLVVTDITD